MHLNEGFVEGLGTEKIEREESSAASWESSSSHLEYKVSALLLTHNCFSTPANVSTRVGNVIFGDFQLRSSLHESPMTSSEDTKLALYSVSHRQHSFSHPMALVMIHCQNSITAAELF